MKTTESEAPPVIAGVYEREAFQRANSHIWPTLGSFNWFERDHRDELRAAGAVVSIGRRYLIVGDKFVAKALEIGKRVAIERVA
jgi:hypothetical protein